VLTAEPSHRRALELARDAHVALDAQSENFWLSSWLRRQAASFEEKLR
jgi:hypothetical protein